MSTLYPRPPRPIHVPQPLCLLCSSSILPSPSTSSSSPRPILTKCCQRTICLSCQTTKGRIARWDPCLACEGGWKTNGKGKERESDFVLGDEDDEDEDEDEEDEEGEIELDGKERTMEAGLDDASLLPDSMSTKKHEDELPSIAPPPPPPTSQPSHHHHHLLLPTDTLLSLSLHYRLDPHHLCTLNNLPFSTIHTTPHLLHTRTHLLLLPSPPPPLPASVQTQLAHERALARFARVTKEQDPLVRRTYVGLAEEGHFDQDEEEGGYEEKKSGKAMKGGVGVAGEGTTEGRAVGKFFEDAEWERENQGGAGGRLRGFPVAGGGSGSSGWKSAGSSAGQSESRGGGSWWSGWGSGSKSVGGGKEVGGGVKVG